MSLLASLKNGLGFPRQQWLLAGLCAALGIVLATVVNADSAKWCIQNLGYWQMLLLVSAALVFLAQHLQLRWRLYQRGWRAASWKRRGACAALILGASVFAHLHIPHQFKVLADEATLLNTSQALHQHRLVYTPGASQYRNGIFFVGAGFIDKRPYLYPFVVSLAHDLTGYRPTNPLWVNAAMTPAIFLMFFLLGRQLHRRYGGALAVLLAMGVPIFAHTLTGAGFEGLNLLLILSTTYLALRSWQKPTTERINLMITTACLLAYCRYESALYIVPVAIVTLAALQRLPRRTLPVSVFAAPLLLAPICWLQTVAFSDEKMYFQLGVRNDPSAFSVNYLSENLKSAYEFFLVPNPVYLSSPLITILGVLGGGALLGLLYKRAFRNPALRRRVLAVLLTVSATVGGMIIFLFFNYGQYSYYITQRISVPVYAALVICSVGLLTFFSKRAVLRFFLVLGVLNLFLFHLPAANGNLNTREYIHGKDFVFVHDFVASLGKEEGVYVYTHTPPIWLTARMPCTGHSNAASDPELVYKALQSGQFNRLLIHVYEYAPGVSTDFRNMSNPPVWFDQIEKRKIASRWVAAGVTVALYEFIEPLASTPVTETGEVSGPSP